MLRTKNELIAIAKEKDERYLDLYVYPKCPTEDKSGKAYSPFDKIFNCLMKQKVVDTAVGHFYSREALPFAKAAEKVIIDMRRGKCPYE